MSARRHLEMRISMGARCIAWFAVLFIPNLPALVVYAQSAHPGIHVEILGIRNSDGAVACALFESAEGFPRDFLRNAINIMMMKVRAEKARCDFLDIPPGTYALAVIHDENLDGKLATNLMGVPTEGYGFSTDAKAVFGPPSFDAASFSYDGDGQELQLTITLKY